jgi:hypothetical protein
MPKSKHRRKPGSKAVAHPGRGKPGRPLKAWLDDLSPDENAAPDVAGLPPFDWADQSREHNISAPGSPTPWMSDC